MLQNSGIGDFEFFNQSEYLQFLKFKNQQFSFMFSIKTVTL